jgi:tetratricopeptide (TPR) repeat protein
MTMGGGGYWFDFQESHTDDQGRFTLPPVRAENPEVKLTFNKPGYKAFSGGTLTRQGDRFIISEAVMGALDRGRTLKGRVVDAAGKPVANAIVAATGVEVGPGETRTNAVGKFILAGVPEESRLLAARGALFGSVPVTRKTAAVTVRLAPAKKAASSVSEDHARARAIIWDIKKRYVASTRQNLKVDDFALRELPLSVAPLDFPLALALAKPEGTNPVDDQTLAQMIREVAQHNPSRLNDWALPALKGIGVSAVRASAAYAAVHGLPEGPAKTALAKQVYAEMQTLTLTGSEHWVVRRLTQMAVLAAMLGQPDESTAWLDKAIAGATEDKDKPYIGVVAHESVSGGLPVVRYVLAKVDSKLRTNLYWEVIAPLARLNARAAQKLLGEMEADSTLTAGDTKNDYARSRALLELVRALAPQDPTAALSIAEQLIGSNHSYSSAAIALSAQGQPDVRKAALLYQRAASLQDATGSAEVLGKIASLAWKNDPAMGEKLFRQANQVIKERNTVPNTHSYGSMVNLAKAVIDIKPGESRLMLTTATGHLLSSEGRKEDTTATYRQTLALAWLPFSADQAMAIAEKLPEKQEKSSYEIRNSTLTKIAVWLLTDPSKRTKRLLAYYDQYGFDTPDY